MKKILLVTLLIIAIPSSVIAQENTIRISPMRSTHSAQPGDTVRTSISLQNPTNKFITVTVVPRDFQASDTLDGQPRLLLDGTKASYGLSNWLADANLDKKITIPANKTVEYEAVFRVPFGLTPKTYFGSVTFKPDTGTIVGSLVFITVGNPETKLSFDSLEYSESQDATKPHGIFTAILKNTSEGLSTPEFRLKITDEQGNNIMELMPDSEGSVLPNSSRRYTFSPISTLPNQFLTVSVTATDQNGTTADKSIQLNRKSNQQIANQVEEIDPKDYSSLFIGGAALFLLGFIITVYLKLKKH